MKIIFTEGIQGSGKSTWSKDRCIKHPDWVRVNSDDLRHMRGQYWLPKHEDVISDMELECVKSALARGYSVIIDAMNLNKERRDAFKKRIIDWYVDEMNGNRRELQFSIKSFTDVPLEECIKRDMSRPNSIGEKIIRKTWEKYLAPEPVVYEGNENLPQAIIVDVDGTLAKMVNRTPYQWDKVIEDDVKEHVAEIVSRFSVDHEIIIVTGRDGIALSDTKKWLDINNIPYDKVFIRPEGDQRKDSIIKKEIFDNHIKDEYNIRFVMDDRDQVVEMWRKELGMQCIQIDYGDF